MGPRGQHLGDSVRIDLAHERAKLRRLQDLDMDLHRLPRIQHHLCLNLLQQYLQEVKRYRLLHLYKCLSKFDQHLLADLWKCTLFWRRFRMLVRSMGSTLNWKRHGHIGHTRLLYNVQMLHVVDIINRLSQKVYRCHQERKSLIINSQ